MEIKQVVTVKNCIELEITSSGTWYLSRSQHSPFSDFDFYFLIVVGISFCIGVSNFVQIATVMNFMKSVILVALP